MDNEDHNKHDVIDEDLYEDIDDEEMYELVQAGKRQVLEKANRAKNQQSRRPFPKWAFWLIALAMVFNMVALLPQTFSIPAIDFLITSAKLSTHNDIKAYKKAVVVIETEDSKGTGFSISSDGTIITNHHVIEGEDTITVAFPGDGLFSATVTEVYPSIDLAILKVDGENLPYLTLADQMTFNPDEMINFIGNPLRFQGIANEGEIIDYTKLSDWDEEVIMIKAPVYRGNSGSPVINQDGKVIGVIFATLQHDQYGKVGLFIPIDYYYELSGREIDK